MSQEQPPEERPQASRSGFCSGCAVGVVVLLVAVIVLTIGVRRAPEKFPGFVRTIFAAREPAAPTEEGGGLSPELVEAARGVKPTLEVALKEDDINAYLEQNPQAIGLPKGFEAPRVTFREGLVGVSVRTKMVVTVRVHVAMRPEVKDGRISLSVVKVRAGGVSLPGEFRQQIQRQAEALIADRIEYAGFELKSVEVGEGELKISGQLKPADDA